jgi:zinc and cadmium transporter
LLLFVSFSAGALIAGAIIHLIPEAFKEYGINTLIPLFFLIGILTFFILEKILHWRHCHIHTKKHKHHLATMNLVGDFFHNFIDGMMIAGSYLVNIQLGLTTTVAVILHEIPQEIGDFGVLLYAGLKKYKALFYNFLSALAAVLGAIVILYIGNTIPNLTMFLLPFTAGGFIYIAGSDLIPELQKEFVLKKSLTQFIFLVLGMLVMYGFMFLE